MEEVNQARCKIEQLKVGMEAEDVRTIKKENVEMFMELSGDKNPIHYDEEYASKTIFKKPIVHGKIYESIYSKILAMQLPGEGAIMMEDGARFIATVRVGDTLTSKLRITEINKEKRRIFLDGETRNQKGEVVLTYYVKVFC